MKKKKKQKKQNPVSPEFERLILKSGGTIEPPERTELEATAEEKHALFELDRMSRKLYHD